MRRPALGAVSLNFTAPCARRARHRHGAGGPRDRLRAGAAHAQPGAVHLLLSSIFVPLFGVVIALLAPDLPPVRTMRWWAALLWLAGIAVFHLGTRLWPSGVRRCQPRVHAAARHAAAPARDGARLTRCADTRYSGAPRRQRREAVIEGPCPLPICGSAAAASAELRSSRAQPARRPAAPGRGAGEAIAVERAPVPCVLRLAMRVLLQRRNLASRGNSSRSVSSAPPQVPPPGSTARAPAPSAPCAAASAATRRRCRARAASRLVGLGVTTVASGNSSSTSTRTVGAVMRPVAAGGDHHRVEDLAAGRGGGSPRRRRDLGVVQHPDLHRIDTDVLDHRVDLLRETAPAATRGSRTPTVFLRRDRGDRGHARSNRAPPDLQVGLDAGAAAASQTGDAEHPRSERRSLMKRSSVAATGRSFHGVAPPPLDTVVDDLAQPARASTGSSAVQPHRPPPDRRRRHPSPARRCRHGCRRSRPAADASACAALPAVRPSAGAVSVFGRRREHRAHAVVVDSRVVLGLAQLLGRLDRQADVACGSQRRTSAAGMSPSRRGRRRRRRTRRDDPSRSFDHQRHPSGVGSALAPRALDEGAVASVFSAQLRSSHRPAPPRGRPPSTPRAAVRCRSRGAAATHWRRGGLGSGMLPHLGRATKLSWSSSCSPSSSSICMRRRRHRRHACARPLSSPTTPSTAIAEAVARH